MKSGQLTLYVGPMFSGKTSRLYNEVAGVADCIGNVQDNFRCVIINSSIDERKTANKIGCLSTHSSHSKASDNIEFVKLSSLSDFNVTDYDCIGIDEAQFFPDLYDSVYDWVNKHNRIVVCSGLDGDANMKSFGSILSLIPLCDKCEKLLAYCQVCAERDVIKRAPFTRKRLHDDVQLDVGGYEKYQSVCRKCYYS
jgi:thymidine kinase